MVAFVFFFFFWFRVYIFFFLVPFLCVAPLLVKPLPEANVEFTNLTKVIGTIKEIQVVEYIKLVNRSREDETFVANSASARGFQL